MKKSASILVSLVLCSGIAVCAQQQPSAHPATEQKTEQSAPGTRDAQSPSQQLAHASNEAAEGEETAAFKHSPVVRWMASKMGISPRAEYWVLYSIDFGIIAALIVWGWKSNIPAAFRTRTATIRKTMEEAQAASAEAVRRLGDIEGRLAKLDQEIAQMRSSAEAEAAAEEARIRAAAEEDSRKIVESAHAEIESSARTAQRDLKAYAAELAVSLAEKKISVDPATDQQLVRNFSRELGSTNGRESR